MKRAFFVLVLALFFSATLVYGGELTSRWTTFLSDPTDSMVGDTAVIFPFQLNATFSCNGGTSLGILNVFNGGWVAQIPDSGVCSRVTVLKTVNLPGYNTVGLFLKIRPNYGQSFLTLYTYSSEAVKQPSPTPTPYHLDLRVMPNPANHPRNISYTLPTQGTVHLDVYDATGAKVLSLFEGRQEAGVHEVSWKNSSLSSGIYTVRLETDQGTKTTKQVVVK